MTSLSSAPSGTYDPITQEYVTSTGTRYSLKDIIDSGGAKVFPNTYSSTFTPTPPMIDKFSGAQTVGITNLMENIKGLEFRLSALEKSYAAKLKEHEETVEMLLKVIKDAAK